MRSFLIPSLAVLALSACDSAPEPAAPTADEIVADSEAQLAEMEQTVASDIELTEAQTFIDGIAAVSAQQVGLADIATREAERDDVKAFAELLTRNHRELLKGLKEATAETSPDLVLNTSLSDEAETALAEMRGALSPDKNLLEASRTANRELTNQIDSYIAEGTYPALVAWATAAKAIVAENSAELAKL